MIIKKNPALKYKRHLQVNEVKTNRAASRTGLNGVKAVQILKLLRFERLNSKCESYAT